MHKHFTTLIKGLQCLLLSASMLWAAASHATTCPHTADIYIDNVPDKTILKIRGMDMNLTGFIQFKVSPKSGGYIRDTCILTFETWRGYPVDIGGNLKLYTDAAFYPVMINGSLSFSNQWPNFSDYSMNVTYGECSGQYSATSANNYRWGGRFSASAVGIDIWGNNINQNKAACNEVIIKVPIRISGLYDGSTVTLYPKNKNISWNQTITNGLYTMAAGEHNDGFNNSAPFQANSSTTTPYVIKEAGCSPPKTTAAPNLSTYTTLTQLPVGQSSAELASFTSETLLTNCNFSPNDVTTFPPRTSLLPPRLDQLLVLEKSEIINNTSAQETFGLYCTNCGGVVNKENIKILVTRTIQAFGPSNSTCNPSPIVSFKPNSGISATGLANCSSLRVTAKTQVIQTGTLLNATLNSSDPSNLSKIYGFNPEQLGGYEFIVDIVGWGLSVIHGQLSSTRFDLTAPFVAGCNSLVTTYPTAPADSLLASFGLLSNQPGSLGVFSSKTTLGQCALDNGKTVGVSGLTLNPSNAGTPTQLSLLSTSTSGPQTLIQNYKLKFNDCSLANLADCPNENLIFKITRNALAFNSTNKAGCNPSYANSNGQLSISNLATCDTVTVDHQTEVLQTGAILNSEPYVFANPLAAFNFSAPLVGSSSVKTVGISNKTFQVVPALKNNCQVVVKSSIQRK